MLALLWSLVIIAVYALVLAPLRKLRSLCGRRDGTCALSSALSAVGLFRESSSDAAVVSMIAARRAEERRTGGQKGVRVAVIGGGIAGTGAAWTLAKAFAAAKAEEKGEGSCASSPLANATVHLFEQRATLGGNAKTHLWSVAEVESVSPDGTLLRTPTVVPNPPAASASNASPPAASASNANAGDDASSAVVDTVRTGLSVLAWPPQYFKTYESLLASLGIATERVTPKFFVATEAEGADCEDNGTAVAPAVPQFRQGSPNPRWAVDMRRWDVGVRRIRHVNRLCSLADGIICAIVSVAFAAIAAPLRSLLSLSSAPSSGDKKARGAAPASVAAGGEPAQPSFYEVCLWNPLNVLTARFFMLRLCGVSAEFWDTVVVPIYSSSFLTTKLDALPAMIIPALDDIISVGSADPLKALHTWREGSNSVFDAMADDILGGFTPEKKQKGDTNNTIVLNAKIASVEWSATEKEWTVAYTLPTATSRAAPSAEIRARYDIVVFACPSEAINTFTNTPINVDSGFRSPLFGALVPQITYENERDVNFTVGHIHCDDRGLPHGGLAEELLARRYTNYVEVAAAPNAVSAAKHRRQRGHRSISGSGPVATSDSVENIFILSTWVPQAVAANKRHFGGEAAVLAPNASNCLRMMVSYNPAPSRRGLFAHVPGASKVISRAHTIANKAQSDVAEEEEANEALGLVRTETSGKVTYSAPANGRALASSTIALVDNSWAHPQLDLPNMLRSQALTMLQGRCNAFYCGNYATPGNGHDLSLLSGVVIADEVARLIAPSAAVGASYPFGSDVAKKGAFEDFHRLHGLMLRSL